MSVAGKGTVTIRHAYTRLAAAIAFVLIVLSLGADVMSQQILHTHPSRQDLQHAYLPPFSDGHLLGTDSLGRDILTRCLHGGRTSLGLALVVAIGAVFVGAALGILAGYYGGPVDDTINFVLQTLRGVPAFFVLVGLATVVTPSLPSLSAVLILLGWTSACRQVRGVTRGVRQAAYCEAAVALGASDWHIMWRHIVPNTGPILSVLFGLTFAAALLAESSLSFLGFGVQPPTASWGNMLNAGLRNMSRSSQLVVVPGALIMLSVMCVFILVDAPHNDTDARSRPPR